MASLTKPRSGRALTLIVEGFLVDTGSQRPYTRDIVNNKEQTMIEAIREMREAGMSWFDIAGEFFAAAFIMIGFPVGMMFLGEMLGY